MQYGHAPPAVGVIAPVALASYIAAFGAAFGAGAALFARAGVVSPFAVALLWTALDHLRSFALSGFPWATLGYAQHENAALLPLASFGGVYALSFVSVLGGASLARVVRLRRLDAAAASGLAAVALAHAIGFGISRRRSRRGGPAAAPRGGAPGQHRPGGQVEPRVGREHARGSTKISRGARPRRGRA